MGNLLSTVFRTIILDDAAFEEWRERPNLFVRGILLIVAVSLVAGLVSFAIGFVDNVTSVDPREIKEAIEQSFQFNPAYQDPEFREMMEELMDTLVPMIVEISEVEAPLPRGIAGFFQAVGGWLSGALRSIGGWLFYGALVLVVANLLGGGAKLPDFLGMVSLYAVPGLLNLLAPIPCVGGVIWLVATIWSIVVYVKAVSVMTDLDVGQSILAVLAPAIAIVLLGLLLLILATLWLLLLF